MGSGHAGVERPGAREEAAMIACALSRCILSLLVLTWQGAAPVAKAKASKNGQTAGPARAQKSPDERFESLLDAARKDPSKADWNALRRAFAQTRHYNPYNSEWKREIAKVGKDLADGNLKAAEPALVKLLERERFMRLEALAMAARLYQKTGDQDKARQHKGLLEGLVTCVFVPESGMSFEKPFVVLFIDEEYIVLSALGLRHRQQSLREKDGHHFDVFTIPAHGDQPEREVFFNIDMPFEALGRSLQGAFDQAGKPKPALKPKAEKK
jgi:hypothetical protein